MGEGKGERGRKTVGCKGNKLFYVCFDKNLTRLNLFSKLIKLYKNLNLNFVIFEPLTLHIF